MRIRGHICDGSLPLTLPQARVISDERLLVLLALPRDALIELVVRRRLRLRVALARLAYTAQDVRLLAKTDELQQWLGCSLFFLEIVRRQGSEPTVFNRAAHSEVVETLPLA